MKRLSVGTSPSPSSGIVKTTTGGTLGRSGGGGGGAASAVGVGGALSATSMAWMYVTPPCVAGLPTTSIHLPVSRLSEASSSKPLPFGFLPVTQTAKASSLMTQSPPLRWERLGRSPYRLRPRN